MRKVLFAVVVVFALLLLTHASTSTAAAAGPYYHVVQPGQNMYSIANLYGMSAWSIAYYNRIWNPNLIYAGQILLIPVVGPGYPYPYPPKVYVPPTRYGCYYRVRSGDTMLGIALRFRGDPWTIARANRIYNLNLIYAGQQLFIPGCN